MIHHIIRLAFRPDVPQEEVEAALGQLRRMGEKIDAVESHCVGRDVGGDFDHSALFSVRDLDAYRAYMHDPLHRETDTMGLPLLERMVSQDLTDDPDPKIAERIHEVHRERFAADPELVALIEGLGSYTGSGRTAA